MIITEELFQGADAVADYLIKQGYRYAIVIRPEGSGCLCPANQSDIVLEAAVQISKGCEDRHLLGSCDWLCRERTSIAPAFNR